MAINRKAGILRRNYGDEEPRLWTKGALGRLSKGKIHCSCWMCKTHYWNEPIHSDKRKLEAWKSQL